MEDRVVILKPLPLVSVICTSYNQRTFIKEALDGIINQEYPELELIICDNGSTDGTQTEINKWLETIPFHIKAQTIFNEVPLPYCKAFNQVLSICKGKYLIDFSGDDIMFPHHVNNSINRLEKDIEAAFCFSDALLDNGEISPQTFFPRNKDGTLRGLISEGDRYLDIVQRYCICSATIVFRTEILKTEGGYDEDLAFEDFDIMVRLARKYRLVFSDHIGIQKRIHSMAFSKNQYRPKNSPMLPSTLKVCYKIEKMNRSEIENQALFKRVVFESKHALWSANFEVAEKLLELGERLGGKGIEFRTYKIWSKWKMDFSRIYPLLKAF